MARRKNYHQEKRATDMKKYQPTIGLEVHVQLKTNTKMFCGCLNEPEEKQPNLNVCPICMGHPGTLPVINKEAIKNVIKTGLTLGCQIAKETWFERKNYFYPDLPKGYQISQNEAPLCKKGKLKINNRDIKINNIHLEEDTGKLIHSEKNGASLVDFNRAGIPLMELATEPDIRSAKEARKFCEELRLILRYLGVSDADMEKGELRAEANISLREIESASLGTKVEIKNLNSFKAVERAIDYEIKRQAELLESNEKIIHETRGWNENKQKTFSQRIKEVAEDYRYFPEPDLPPLKISKKEIEKIKAEIPELPDGRRKRFKKEYKISDGDTEVFTNYKALGDYFEKIISELKNWEKIVHKKKLPATHLYKLIKLTANYLITELKKYLTNLEDVKKIKITPENFAEFIILVNQDKISSSAAQTVLKEMFEIGIDPSHVIEEKDLTQVSDESKLKKIIEKVIKNNPKPVEDYKKGKKNALQFLLGQVMKLSKGKANPQIVGKILKKKLAK
jgi:aspartyl-tRNA(Asn)/glutamyl-tRNA(Gln) amidotransferase subunit B